MPSFEQLELLEEWRQVVGYEGFYEVSNLGRVRSVARNLLNSRGQLRHYPGVIMWTRLNRDGYVRVALSKNGKYKEQRVHSLVCLAFLGLPLPGFQVDHLSGNKLDNSLGNLEYVSIQENLRRARDLGLSVRGERSKQAKLTHADVVEIRRLRLEGMTQMALAAQFGVSQPRISYILIGKGWKESK